MDETVPDDEITAEHARLLLQMEELEREHAALEKRPYDKAAHREHMQHLLQKKQELRMHMLRLKRRRAELEQK